MRTKSNQVRIIAGQWRGRKLTFPDEQGLRPTADRIRETLFNWLAPLLPGAHCLDLFAGSGALGFEAASRGAGRVVMVEKNPKAVQMLLENKQQFAASAVEIRHDDAQHYLSVVNASFDIIFLDPPFADTELRETVVTMLAQSGCIKAGGHVYLETPKQDPGSSLPEGWTPVKRKTAGEVAYQLYRLSDQAPG